MKTNRLLLMGIVLLVALAFVGVASACEYGCTPGYWKNHLEVWYTPDMRTGFGDLNGDGIDPDTPLDALKYHGGNDIDGARRILTRAYVAAVLNKAAFGDDFPGPDNFYREFWDTFDQGDRQEMIDLAGIYDGWNNGVCESISRGQLIGGPAILPYIEDI